MKLNAKTLDDVQVECLVSATALAALPPAAREGEERQSLLLDTTIEGVSMHKKGIYQYSKNIVSVTGNMHSN